MINVRTDLVLEAREIYKESHKDEVDIDGIEVIEESDDDIKVTTVKVKMMKVLKNWKAKGKLYNYRNARLYSI